jgi:hypothetical protein
MGIESYLSTCVGTQSPKYLEMAKGHISLSVCHFSSMVKHSQMYTSSELGHPHAL